MPVDQKRVCCGPENSFPYKYHSRVNIKSQEDRIKELFDENGLRMDRKNGESRKICKFLSVPLFLFPQLI
jgi:hypothetical protein